MVEADLLETQDIERYAARPEELLDLDRTAAIEFAADDVEKMQLLAVRARFAMLRDKLPALANLAKEHGISEIESLTDAAKLLFKHSVYKSYPISLVEKGQFDRLTQWLGKLTTVDLSAVKTSDLNSIDDWLDALLRDANVRIIHSTGTSGKLSFLPIGPEDIRVQTKSAMVVMQELGQPKPEGLEDIPMIVVGHRVMYNGYGAKLEAFVKDVYHGDESMLYVMDPGRLSADVLSLGGRLAAAEGRGALGRSELAPSLAARLDDFIAEQRAAPERRAKFFDRVFDTLKGRRVMLSGNWAMLYEIMEAGRQRGLSDGVFAPDSLIQCAGGTKGRVFPEGYREDIKDFLGVPTINEAYGMSEITSLMGMCEARHYHVPPWLLVFVLDPETGQPSPREGTHTGRFGVIDLGVKQRWPGVLSGDEVTMSFDTCACGRPGPHIADTVRRFSEREGGDDKITCAGAPEAHDNALAFLADLAR